MSNNGEQLTLWDLVQRDYGYTSPDDIQDGDTLDGLECEGIGVDWEIGASSYVYFSRFGGELYASMNVTAYSGPDETVDAEGNTITAETIIDWYCDSLHAPDLSDMLTTELENGEHGRRFDVDYFAEHTGAGIAVFQGSCDVKLSDTLGTLDAYSLGFSDAVRRMEINFWSAVVEAGHASATGEHDWHAARFAGAVTCRDCGELRDEYSADTCPAWK